MSASNDVLEFGPAVVFRVCCGPLDSLCYLVVDRESDETALIDAGCPADVILRTLEDLALQPKFILVTHTHFDHISSAREISESTRAPAMAHPADVEMLPSYWMSRLGEPPRLEPSVEDGMELEFGGLRVRAIHTPGHTPGSVCYLVEEAGVIFTGDTLFRGAVGRTDFAGGDPDALRASLSRLATLPDETVVLPGHGRETTIGAERDWLRKRGLI